MVELPDCFLSLPSFQYILWAKSIGNVLICITAMSEKLDDVDKAVSIFLIQEL
jgi:hypothetical protein